MTRKKSDKPEAKATVTHVDGIHDRRITVAWLERAACSIGGCEGDGPLVLSPKCHLGAPMFMDQRTRGAVTFRCVQPTCFDKPVAEVACDLVEALEGGAFHDNGLFEQKCHDTAAVKASYERGSGRLEVTCYHCRKPVASVVVKGGS